MTEKPLIWRTVGLTLVSCFGLKKKYAVKDLQTDRIICYVASEEDQDKLMEWVRENLE